MARNALFRLDQIAQKREHARVGKICSIRAHQVWRLARALGISLPASQLRSFEGPRNICHALGSALSALFTSGHGPAPRKRTYAYPVRVLGSGVAGVAFCMSDGTVIKAVALRGGSHNKAVALRGEARRTGEKRALAQSAPARARTAGLASYGRAVPLREFLYETRITRRAHDTFDSSRAGRFRVPRVLRHVVLEGRLRHGRPGGRVGVMQLSWAPGVTLHEAIERSPPAVGAALARRHGRALAAVHEKGWVHGDMHSSNVIVNMGDKSARRQGAEARADTADFTVIDWARANTLRSLLRNHPGGEGEARKMFNKILRYEVAHPYRNYMRSASRAVAEAFLAGYLKRSSAAKGKGVFGGPEPLVEVRALRSQWDALMNINVGAMFRALDISAEALHRRRRHRSPSKARR